MKKTNQNLILLNGAFIMSLLVSNVVGGKIVQIGFFQVTSAVVAYGITFLCTDVIGELWGKKEANQTVKNGFFLQIFSLLLITLAIKLKPAPFMVEYSESFNIVFNQSGRVVFASLIAYLISQANDVFIFHRLKTRTNGKHKWLRNNVSTLTSQFIDTIIFITIAFHGVVPNLRLLIFTQYIVKLIIALLDTPIFYLLTRRHKGGE